MRRYKCLLGILLSATLFNCKWGNPKKENEIQETTGKPNIIWLMAEDISTDLECYGMPNVKTPNLNLMAKNGIRFTNAFVTNPICSPSRSAMMVGTHQLQTNTQHHRSNRDIPLNAKYKPFTALLREAGYTTILGHHGVMKNGRKIDVNFKHDPLGPWDGKTQFGLFDKYDTFETADQPFFAQIQLVATHRGDWWDAVRQQSKHPVNPDTVTLPPYMADHPVVRLDWAKYLDQIEYIDAEVGMIFKELESKGMIDNTIVIFIGDNGRCNIRGKGYLFDPGLHIPLIMWYPSRFAGGSIRKEVISATDITASIIDFAGVPVPQYMTGQPIFSKEFNRTFNFGARDLWDEIEEKSRAITSKEWSYIRHDMPEVPFDAHQAYLEFYRPAVHAMRKLYAQGQLNSDEAYFFQPSKPNEELYNLINDPNQLDNLALKSEYSNVLDSLRQITKTYENSLVPVSSEYEPIIVEGKKIIAWLKVEMPQDYNRMLAGEEIGYGRVKSLYKAYKSKKNP